MKVFLATLAAIAAFGCSKSETEAVLAEVPPDAFAVVGESVLGLGLLSSEDRERRVEQAKGVVRDELFRQESMSWAPHSAQAVSRGVLARALMRHLEEESSQKSPVTLDELKAERQRLWLEYDRPRAVRTVQVLFPVPPLAPDQEYYQRAQRVREAVEGAHNLREFGDAARAVLTDEDKTEVYEMPPLAADGRMVPQSDADRNVGFVPPELGKAAAQLQNPGDISDVVGTKMGYHIFFATEVIPEKRRSLEEAREDLTRSVLSGRVQKILDKIVKEPAVPVKKRRDDVTQLLTLISEDT